MQVKALVIGVAAVVVGCATEQQAVAEYGDYSSSRPSWLDQNLTSSNGSFVIWYCDEVHHSAPFAGDPDSDGDSLPDTWETTYLGGTGPNQLGDQDVDGYNNGQEYQSGSWPNNDYFRPLDTIDAATDAQNRNLVVRDQVDCFLYCQSRYADWGFNAAAGLPLTVYIQYTPYGGWGGVNPLWCSPDIVGDFASPNRLAVAIHELFHNVQRAYPDVPRDTKWFIEGSARMSEDYFYSSIDTNPASKYCGEVAGFLGDPAYTNLFARSYSAVFFWKYLCEQTGGSIVGQPFENFDAMDSFMQASNNHEGEDAVQAYLDSLPPGHYWHNAEFDRFYGTWVTAIYTRQFNASSLPAPYYYRDEQENLPTSLLRPVKIENCAYNLALNSYLPETIAANGSRFYNDADSNTWCRQLQPRSSCYYAFMPSNAQFFLVWADGKTGQRNYYATVGVRGGDVQTIDYAFAEDFRRVYYGRSLSEVGVVVAALDATADYDLMVWGLSEFSLNILYPRTDEKEVVRLLPDTFPRFDVHVEVRAYQTGNPAQGGYVEGLPPDLFVVTVGGVTATVVSGHSLGPQYWLSCTSSNFPPGDYDLRVRLLSQSDQENQALRFAEGPHVDRMIVIDRSGSMGSELMGNNEKIQAAKSGARLYADLMMDNDMLGLVSFGGDDDDVQDDATLHKHLQTVTDPYRTLVKNSINTNITDDPSQYEHTAMGQGVLTAYNDLVARGVATDEWRIALLSDGIEDIEPYWNSPAVSGVVVSSTVKIDVIALGVGAHQSRLRQIATQTEGAYFFVPVPTGGVTAAMESESKSFLAPMPDPVVENWVSDVFAQIHERDHGLTRIWSSTGSVSSVEDLYFEVYEGMSDLALMVNWPKLYELKTQLIDPLGYTNSATYTDYSHNIFKMPTIAGTWRIRLTSGGDTVPYLAILTGYGELAGTLLLTEAEGSSEVGAIEKICLALSKKNRPVTGAQVVATVRTPSERVTTLLLYDDGDHGDMRPGDGIYSRDYRLTPEEGDYRVTAVAEGMFEDEFYRMEENGFFWRSSDRENSDWDYDGMGTWWEIRYGLNPHVDDADGDPDADGVKNIDEFTNGGNPRSDDTDHGGTQDGSELANGRNMLTFEDDLIAPPSALVVNLQPTDDVDPSYVAPGSGRNLLYWSRGKNYRTLDIYRSTDPDVGFSRIARNVPANTRPYKDEGLTDGVTYYYKVTAISASGLRTRMSEAAAGIPKSDNIWPWGGVRVVGSWTVASLSIPLALWATPDTTHMRLANEGSFEGSGWIAFATNRDWTIGGYPGVNYIFVQFRDAAGNCSLPFSTAVNYQLDTDGDEMGDSWEMQHFGGLSALPNGDSDADGLLNLEEFQNGLNPKNQDTDGDAMPDGWELNNGFNPLVPDSVYDADRDQMLNWQEYIAGTYPRNSNSVLRMMNPQAQPYRLHTTLTWPSVTGRRYSIFWETNLLNEKPFSSLLGTFSATPPLNSYTDTTHDTQSGYYRVRVSY